MAIENRAFPRWLRLIARWSLPGTFLLVLDVTYNELCDLVSGRANDRIQRFHLLGPIVLVAWVSVMAAQIFLLALILIVIRWIDTPALKRGPLDRSGSLFVCVVALYIPDRFWKRATVNLLGPGPTQRKLSSMLRMTETSLLSNCC